MSTLRDWLLTRWYKLFPKRERKQSKLEKELTDKYGTIPEDILKRLR